MGSFLFACDSFKGTLSSARSSELLAEEARAFFPEADFRSLEVADGGEGTVDAIVASLGGQRVSFLAADPLGRPVEATYGMLPGERAVIEMAAAAGLPLAGDRGDPERTTTYGVGELIRHAVESVMDAFGVRRVYGFFGNSIDPIRGKPTNAEMIGMLAQYMRVTPED